MSNYTIVGQPVRRVDGFEKVSGLIHYGVGEPTAVPEAVRTIA